MQDKKILVVGLGATGSHTVLALRSMPVLLAVCDFDIVEDKNVSAQMHAMKDVGKKKTVSISSMLMSLFKVKPHLVNLKIGDENISAVLEKGYDLVIDCTDNKPARDALSKGCEEAAIELLHVGMSEDGDFAMVMWDEHFTADEAPEGVPTCENGETLPFHVSVGGLTAIVVQKFINDGLKKNLMINPTQVMEV
jgi:siroheme synthase (precorrin-2 oxidase/ferrochelatase)